MIETMGPDNRKHAIVEWMGWLRARISLELAQIIRASAKIAKRSKA